MVVEKELWKAKEANCSLEEENLFQKTTSNILTFL